MKHRPSCMHINCTSNCPESRTNCATATAVDRYGHINENDVIRVERVGTPTAWEGHAVRIRKAGPEPIIGSVVLDAKSRAWQRRNDAGTPMCWRRVGMDWDLNWQELNDREGPIQQVYQPTQAAS